MPLRPGQRDALRKWDEALARGERSELVVVPVGYGKTVIGAGSFVSAQRRARAEVCLYVTPTDVLRRQVYSGFERAASLGGSTGTIRKILAENASAHRIIATNANVVVASYQQIAASPAPYERLCRARRVHLVCDEAHHLGESGRWAEAIGALPVESRLMLSATPIRLDRDTILGARYTRDVDGSWAIEPLLEVSMRQAWSEGGILKHLNLQMKDYEVELSGRDGTTMRFTASQMADLPGFDQTCVREQLRWNDDYVAPLVREFAHALIAKRQIGTGRHQGLVFAATTEHANHLYRVFGRHHASLRCVVVHSADLSDGENQRRMEAFHAGKHDVLIQVRKASEGFDAPSISALLKLDGVFSREPVIQQLGRGLRFNHDLPEAENVLNVFVGRDHRFVPILEFLEREYPARNAQRDERPDKASPGAARDERDVLLDDAEADEAGLEVLDVAEAGDAYVDHTGRFVDGQQLTLFGETAAARPSAGAGPSVNVVDIAAELQEAIRACSDWTTRLARERGRRGNPAQNQFQLVNAEYARQSGLKGALSTPAQYLAKAEWMKERYLELIRASAGR